MSVFNKSDDRFTSGTGARRAWMTVEPSDASEILGINLEDDEQYTTDAMGREIMSLNILSPAAGDHQLRVQIVDTVDATEWDAQNIETRAKRKGKDGPFITHEGRYIFTQSSVVFGEPNNVFLEADAPAVSGGILANQNVSVETGEIFS